jgi:hypothetical protein
MDAIGGLVGNNITTEVTLKDLNLQLKWSKICKLPIKFTQETGLR